MTGKETNTISNKLRSISACDHAIEWASDYTDEQKAWDECLRGDWMLWLLGGLSGKPGSSSRKAVVLCACECARLALPQYEIKYPDDKRPRIAIETTEAYCRGEATLKEVRVAATAAYAFFASDATADAVADAAYTAYGAYAIADAVAYHAAAAAVTIKARSKRLAECAEIVRKHFPKVPVFPESI